MPLTRVVGESPPCKGEFLLVALVAFATFANSLRGGFVFDDNQAIVTNADVIGGNSLLDAFKNDFWGSPIAHPGSHRSYRPLTILSFRINHFFGRLNPIGFHLVNVIPHCAVTCLVLKLSSKFVEKRESRLFSALLFAVHPIHCEAVANLVGRADILATLISLIAYLYDEKYQNVNVVGVLCLIGLGFKETTIAVLPIVAARAHLSGEGRRRCVQLLLWMGVLSFLRLWINGFRSPEFSASDNPIAHHPSFFVRTATFLYLPLFNLGLLIAPVKLCFDWSMDSISPITSLLDYRLWMTLAFYSGATVTLHRCFLSHQAPPTTESRKRKRSPSPRYDMNANLIPPSRRNSPIPPEEVHDYRTLIAVCFLVIPFLPASNLVAYVGFVVAERILYLPSVGFCMLAAMLYDKADSHYRKAFYVVLILLALRSYTRNEDWNDEESLYRSAVHINPAKAHSNLGNILTQKKRFDEAKESYEKALEHRPNMADTHYNMGVLYMDQKDFLKAIDAYKKAIHFRPSFASAHLNLGLTQWNTKLLDKAEMTFRECARIDGTKMKNLRIVEAATTGCRYNLGRLLSTRGRVDDAITVYREAVEKMPLGYDGRASLFNMLGEALFKKGMTEEAEVWYEKALGAKESHVPAYLTLANLKIQQNEMDKARRILLEAVRVEPNNPSAHLHLARFHSLLEDWTSALESFKIALNLQSGQPDADALLGAANAYRQLGNNQKAEEFFEILVTVRPDAVSFANYGAILHLNKNYEKAEAYYQKALEKNPGDEVTAANLRKLRRIARK